MLDRGPFQVAPVLGEDGPRLGITADGLLAAVETLGVGQAKSVRGDGIADRQAFAQAGLAYALKERDRPLDVVRATPAGVIETGDGQVELRRRPRRRREMARTEAKRLLERGDSVRVVTGTRPDETASKQAVQGRPLFVGYGRRVLGVRIIAEASKLNADVDALGINQIYENEGGKLVLHIETITAEGRGKEFFQKSVLPQIDRYHIGKITLDAARIGRSQVGSYAWARYGFVPVREEWDGMREAGQAALEEEEYSSIPREVKNQAASVFKDPSPKALRRLIFLSWKERLESKGTSGQVTRLLNRVLARKWTGELDLTDPKSVNWLEIYVTVNKAEERLADFEKLLEPPTPTGLLSWFKRKK